MSFILDALKKSENERQGQGSLGVADVAVARDAPRAPGWIWWLIGLLGVNLIVLMVVLLRPADPADAPAATTGRDAGISAVVSPPPAARPEPVARPAAEPAASVPETVAPALAAVVDRARADREREPDTGSAADDTRAVPDAGPTGSATIVPAPPPRESVPARRAPQGAEPLALPTLDELRARGTTSLPELHVDIHVFSERPGERFVYINTRKYREGNELSEGPRVQTIVEEGVVLQHQGTRFLLPRE